jgi:hypothetical protein
MSLHLVYRDPGGVGYHPVLHMVHLAAELFDAQLTIIRQQSPTFLDKLAGVALPRRREGNEICLLICASPSDLQALLLVRRWRSAFSKIVAWVFDSFWVNHTPRFLRAQQHLDHIFLTEPEDMEAWSAISRTPVSWLPWGSDVLRLGSANSSREVDILRFGRQPPDWSNDDLMNGVCAAHGLVYRGRPPAHDDPHANQREVSAACAHAKFTLSFSNRVSPSLQTHPIREYITARWTDALANGAAVAGVPPNTEVIDKLLWPEALLPLATTNLDSGLNAIGIAVRNWTPRMSAHNHLQALRRLDWRWRFKAIADVLALRPEKLIRELAAIDRRVSQT